MPEPQSSAAKMTVEAPANRLLTGEVSFQIDAPCPRCGERTLMGYYYLTPDDGQHQHTHYVCLSWPRDRRERCGWHGWTVPDA